MITLHPHPPIRDRQLQLLKTLQELQKSNTRQSTTDFMWASAKAFRQGNDLSLEQIKEIFDEVYGAPSNVTDNQS